MSIREYTDKSGKITFFWNHYPEGYQGRRVNTQLPEDLEDKEAAQKYVEDILLVKKADPEPGGSGGSTIKDLWPSYLTDIEREKADTTYIDVEIAGRHLCKVVGDITPAQLNKGYINLYKDTRLAQTHGAKNISKRTVNKELSWLSGFLSWCDENNVPTPSDLKIKRFKYRRPIPTVLTIEEALKIITSAEPVYRSFFGCLYLAGMRFTEARYLERERINDDEALVTGKGNKQRMVPVPGFLLGWINAVKPAGTTGYVHMSVTNNGGTITDLRTALARAAKAAGVTKHVYPHLMRHTFATHALTEWDIDIKTLQEYLGHSDLSATSWYLHVTKQHVKRAGKKMEASIQPLVDSFSRQTPSNTNDQEPPFSTC